jgi:hypothetical protein
VRIEFGGATVCVIGRFKSWTKKSIRAVVEDAGGRVVGTPAKGGLVLLGANPAAGKLTQARARGCTFVEGEDAYTLLERGVVEVEPAAGRSLDDLIGEARAVLAEGASRDGFAKLVALLDGCAPEHTSDLATYLGPLLDPWGVAHEDEQTSHEHSISWASGDVTGPCAEAAGHIRSMPVHWVAELLAGERSPKHSICDALSFSRVEVSTSAAAKLFEHDTLEHFRVFSLGETNTSSHKKKTFFKKMLTSTTLAAVETFIVHSCDPEGLGLLLEHPECMPRLTRLDLVASRRILIDTQGTTHPNTELARAWSGQLEAMRITHQLHVDWLVENPGALPALDHLIVSNDASEFANETTWAPMAARLPGALGACSRLTLACHALTPLEAFLGELAQAPPQALRTLDLSANIIDDLDDPEAAERVADALTASDWTTRLERVVLNTAFADAVRERLVEQGAHVDVVTLH